MIGNYIKQIRTNIRAYFVHRLRTNEVARVLSVAHAQELKETPINEWPRKIMEHRQQIKAVMAGNLDRTLIDRRSWAYPYLPEALHRLNQPILKNTPYNLRRFSETPIPRRAINLLKNGVLSLQWEVTENETVFQRTPEIEKRIRIATNMFKHPNWDDDWRSFSEQVLEDIIAGGYGTIEPRITPDPKRPMLMFPVDGSTIRIFADWTQSTPDRPRYAQMTGLKGERGIIAFLDNELIYIKDNNRSSTPFGLGKLEVAFNTINAFLGVQDMASRAGADQIHKTMLWWQGSQQQGNLANVRRYLQNELEGQSKISLISGMQKPEVIDIQAVNPEDLLLDWQQFLIKIIGAAFDISPISLGIDQHTNRATGQVMADMDWNSAVVPLASRFQEALTYRVLHRHLKWNDLKFVFNGLEDPDAMTLTTIQQRRYQTNSITPDEIRKANGEPPLPGGWGRLTMGQIQLLITEASAKLKGSSPSGGGASGMGSMGAPKMGGGFGGGSLGTGSIGAAGLSPDEIASLSPEDIQYLQNEGLLPPTQELGQQMEEEQPGILESMTLELRDFFDIEELLEEENQVEPEEITSKDVKEQIKKFKNSQRPPVWREAVINNRGNQGTPGRDFTDRYSNKSLDLMPGAVAQQTMRQRQNRKGKYPRSGGQRSDYR